MTSPAIKHTYKTDSDLLKTFRRADAAAKYLQDTDEKLLSYHSVLEICANSKKCLDSESIKKNQILFWTYARIGDLFLQKNLDSFETKNKINALNAYQNALEFSNNEDEQFEILEKIRDLYRDLEDAESLFKTSAQMALVVDDALKIQTFLRLARESPNQKQEAYFLEQALQFVTNEKIAFLRKCKDTLAICARLLEIYQTAGLKADEARIRALSIQAKEFLN